MTEERNKVLSGLYSGAIITVVTVLIWLLAESEGLRVERVQVKVAFRADADSGRLIMADPSQDFTGNVAMTLEGSTAAVDALSLNLRKEIRLEPGTEGIPGAPGVHTIQMKEALDALPVVRNSGVTLADVDPPTVTVIVDNVVTRDAAVRVEIPPGQSLDGAAESSPAAVKIRLPESLARATPGELVLIARVDASRLAGVAEGRRTTITGLPLELPEPLRGIEAVRIIPPQVNVALTLRSRSGSFQVASVPIHIRLAPTETGMWDISLPADSRLLSDVSVSGPSDLIDKLKADNFKLVAFVAPSFEELERAASSGEPLEKEILFSDLPSLVKVDARQKTVRLTIKRRERAVTGSDPKSS